MTPSTIVSSDGTRIAFDRVGDGPPLVLVVGAFNTRDTGAPLARALAARHAVYTYDRRGRGDSGDTAPYEIDRELDDLAALLAHAGGAAAVLGFSSGAALALHAAARGLAITRLALYDLPLVAEGAPGPDHRGALDALVRAGRRGDAVEYFQREVVRIPPPVIAELRRAPFRAALEAMAHTLVYDMTITGDGLLPRALLPAVRAPTLAIVGEASPPFMRATAEALARAVADGRALVLAGAGHELDPARLAPVVDAFLQ
jgi:pimeloyl-ACP methyl ester carboxylesterase